MLKNSTSAPLLPNGLLADVAGIDYSAFKSYKFLRSKDRAEVISFSGGRSSAYLLMMLINGGFGQEETDIISFQNTGKEHETCYVFLKEIEQITSIPIVWLEYTLTDKFYDELVWSSFSYDKFDKGQYTHIGEILNIKKLMEFKYEKTKNNFWYKYGFHDSLKKVKRVTFETASRNGKPFTDVFLYKCAVRLMKGEGFILPSAGQRWCTGDMKEKTLHQYLKNIGISKYNKYVGMRADEPIRVDRMFRRNSANKEPQYDCPLHWENVNKIDVMKAWKKQPIDLGLSNDFNIFKDVMGNCIFCHLKSKIKKQFLMQQGFDFSFYKQIERIANNYNGDTDAMNRSHGTYEQIESEINRQIKLEEVLSDTEVEISCVGCGD